MREQSTGKKREQRKRSRKDGEKTIDEEERGNGGEKKRRVAGKDCGAGGPWEATCGARPRNVPCKVACGRTSQFSV